MSHPHIASSRSCVTPLLVALLLIGGCSAFSSEDDNVVEGVDFDVLFAPPTAAEIEAIEHEWAQRTVAASNVRVLHTDGIAVDGWSGRITILSHDVGGVEHVGAVIVPLAEYDRPRPVLMYLHADDDGVSIDNDVENVLARAGDIRDMFILVIPSFRSESIRFGGQTFTSEGPPSPWDRDVDDALSLLDVTFEQFSQADPERVAAVGFSRGATVAMLMAIRDPRIDGVVEFFGATDYFGPFVQDVIRDALRGRLRLLPAIDYVNDTYIQPLKNRDLRIADVRPELTRRSPVYFLDRMPPLQVHHGLADPIVPVAEAERLIEAMNKAGATDFESFLYPDGSHHPITLPGSLERALEFLLRVTGAAEAPPA